MKKYTHNSETIIDEDGIELLVGYDFERIDSYCEFPENSASIVEGWIETELTSVEVIIKGRGIDLLPLMNEDQKGHIVSLLNYELW
jgi:hypothetical protein